MNFYQSVFPEKKLFQKYSQKSGFVGNYPSVFRPTLSGQSCASKNIFFKSRLYMPQFCGVAKKSKTFKFWYFFTANMIKLPYEEKYLKVA